MRPFSALARLPPLSRLRPLVRARPLSTSPPPPPSAPTLMHQTIASVAAGLNAYGPAVGLGVSGMVVVYGVSSLAWTVGGSFMSLTLKDALYWGFASGFLSAGLLGAGALRGYRSATLRTQPVFNLALAKLRKDERVAAALGATIQPGTLKAYDRVAGHVSTTKLAWVDPRVQMIFQVVGVDTGREAMATVEAVKHKGVIKLTLLALDIAASRPGQAAQDPIVVEGTEERLHVRGQLRGFLQAERSKYIEQDVVVSDEARLEEQRAAELTAEADKKALEELGIKG